MHRFNKLMLLLIIHTNIIIWHT